MTEYKTAHYKDDGYVWGTLLDWGEVVWYIGGELNKDGGAFVRWPNINIPVGATITSAYVSFYFDSVVGTPPESTITFDDQQNSGQIASASDFRNRSRTTASVAWTPPVSGTWSYSSDISTIIQELVDSYDYSSGSYAMQMLIDCPDQSSENWSAFAGWSSGANAYSARLTIDYTEAAAGNPYYAYAQM